MSASYVRDTFRAWAQQTAGAVGFAFYDTINQNQDPNDTVWWTVVFTAEFMEGTFCNPGYIENGFITVIVSASPGTGDSTAIQALEAIIPDLMQKIDPTQRLVLESYEPVGEESGGSVEQDYRVSVAINYQHSL